MADEVTVNEIMSMSETDLASFANKMEQPATTEPTVVATVPEAEAKQAEQSETTTESQEVSEAPTELNSEEFYAALTAPLTASGKELSFSNPDEIRTLMQKGINYEQRMGHLKKFQRHVETLDKENLLNDDTLNLFVEMARGKPEALKQFIANNPQIDIYDVIGLDTESYTPEKHIPSEDEYEKSLVKQEVTSLPDYTLVQDLVEKTWDEASRTKLLADPTIVSNMIQAAKVGIHDMILAEAEKVKLLTSQPVTDLDAYIQAGTKLHQQGKFKDKISKQISNVETITPKTVAANPSGSKKTTGEVSIRDLANMSIEELEAFANANNL